MKVDKSKVGYLAVGLLCGVCLSWAIGRATSPKKTTPLIQPVVTSPNGTVMSHPKQSSAPGSSRITGPVIGRKPGRYVLDSDVLWIRDKLVDQVLNTVDYQMSIRDPEYARLFEKWGLDNETSLQLRHHIAQIYRAKVEICQAETGLVKAQVALDERMMKLLGSRYSEFLAYEASYAPKREITQIESHFAQAGLAAPTPVERAVLQELIQEYQAFSNDTLSAYNGPFDPLPKSWSGPRAIPLLQERHDRMIAGMSEILASAPEIGLSKQTTESVAAYYSNQAAVYMQMINDIKDPVGASIRRTEADIAKMRGSPETDPRSLAAALRHLDHLKASRKPGSLPGDQ